MNLEEIEAFCRMTLATDYIDTESAAHLYRKRANRFARTDVPALIAEVRRLRERDVANDSVLMFERDDLKKRLRDMVFERNDVRDKLDIYALDLVTAKRERDAARDDLAFILAEYANERNEELNEDALCLKIAGLTHQRDDARTQLAMVEAWHKQMCLSAERGWAQEAERTRERDEARAEVERFRDWYRNVFGGPSKRETPWDPCACEECESLRRLKDERLTREPPVHPSNLTDVVSLLEDERDELLVRVANQDAELRATREAYIDAKWATAYRRGAEAMREACAARLGSDAALTRTLAEHLEREVRNLPIPEEP